MDIIGLAFRMTSAVAGFVQHARHLYYAVVLMGHPCPRCGQDMVMLGEGRCACRSCGHEFDPTEQFQRCADCGGPLKLRVRRYRCRNCGSDVASRFLFDGLVFDATYFKQRMIDHRRRRKAQRERVRRMLSENRSRPLDMTAIELNDVPGLVEALNGLTDYPAEALPYQPAQGFDLKRYQGHLQAQIGRFPLAFDRIPALSEDARKDRVWRFIAIIFMAHMGLIDLWQSGRSIMVMKHETDREGQDIPGDTEGVDGVERPLGRVEA